VEKLLAKVHGLSDQESARMRDASAFVSQLSASNAELVRRVAEFQSDSSTHSEALCGGVATMLEKGRSTCKTLTESIDKALTTLTGDAKIAGDSMKQSCDGLKTHLISTKGTEILHSFTERYNIVIVSIYINQFY
jgi:hypothetical protein